MASLYGSNEHKQYGIQREPFVAQRIYDYLRKNKMIINMEKALPSEDMNQKFDYKYTCNENQSFDKKQNITEIKVDVKCAKTFTLIDRNGKNTLENSESTFIVFELEKNAEKLLWINTGKLKMCLDNDNCRLELFKSKEEGNESKYFWIQKFIQDNKYHLKGAYDYL